ncbi:MULTISPECIES: bacteriohemerythrin [unclassified Synechocystis]|uniref:bacteriohemerythrin n=1 Tax=unclassified Synechocystis TaxID=2640012 RepID=UPI0003F55A25|nr:MULTISPECIES: bacteriohemerythrin [unclassified Synechocystis]AIE73927.1 Methyl-accepting chemotaxis protein [Synechocystis sp. PCC 6714]MCT0252496.1 bacteriohemerythrin [Synechocystis sp. CS-94]
MGIAVWSEDLACGYELIDLQHQHLFSLINSLDESLQKPITREELSLLLADLLEYTGFHFRCEEELMWSLDYPHLFEHRTIHEKLTKQVMDLQFRLQHEESTLAVFFDVSSFLADWLRHHIQENDIKMIHFVRRVLKEKQEQGKQVQAIG